MHAVVVAIIKVMVVVLVSMVVVVVVVVVIQIIVTVAVCEGRGALHRMHGHPERRTYMHTDRQTRLARACSPPKSGLRDPAPRLIVVVVALVVVVVVVVVAEVVIEVLLTFHCADSPCATSKQHFGLKSPKSQFGRPARSHNTICRRWGIKRWLSGSHGTYHLKEWREIERRPKPKTAHTTWEANHQQITYTYVYVLLCFLASVWQSHVKAGRERTQH